MGAVQSALRPIGLLLDQRVKLFSQLTQLADVKVRIDQKLLVVVAGMRVDQQSLLVRDNAGAQTHPYSPGPTAS